MPEDPEVSYLSTIRKSLYLSEYIELDVSLYMNLLARHICANTPPLKMAQNYKFPQLEMYDGKKAYYFLAYTSKNGSNSF